MRKLIMAFAVLFIFSSSAHAQTWAATVDGVMKSVSDTTAEAAGTRAIMKSQQEQLDREYKALKQSIAVSQAGFDKLEKEYKAMLELEKRLEDELETKAHELKTIEGTMRSSVRQARESFHESLTSSEFPTRLAQLDELLRPGSIIGLSGIEKLVSMYADEVKAGGAVVLRNGEFTAADGFAAQGEILRAGLFTAAYRTSDGETGFLRPLAGGTGLGAVQGDAGWTLS